jgi:hypothetical protein
MDLQTFIETCRSRAAARLSTSATDSPSTVDVYDSRSTVNDLDFTNVPTWSDADIVSQFASIRDVRYMTNSSNPTFQRRITWEYPDNGCYARAEQFDVEANAAGKTRPYKIFAFVRNPSLRVYTPNALPPADSVTWWYHVVPLVKNSAGEPIVFDPAISPCKPLPYKTWLATMVDDMAYYDDIADPSAGGAGNGVAVSDSGAYGPFDPVTGATPQSALSLTEEQDEFLPLEWERQTACGRDPSVVLGPSPPWSGNACVFTETRYTTIDVPGNSSASATVTCPFATLSVGGGFLSATSPWPPLLISKNAKKDNGWEIDATNTTAGSKALTASAVCLTGAPMNATVTTVTGPMSWIQNNSYNSTAASCSSGILVGGGFSTNVAGSPSSIMKIYSNSRTASTGNTWQVSAYNTTGSTRTVTPYAYCLTNSTFSVSQTSGSLSPEGIAVASCSAPLVTLGGGFAFPRAADYKVVTMDNEGQVYAVDMLPPPESTDPNAKAYAECLGVPTPTTCTVATAINMGAEHSMTTVAGDGCLKITQYPGSWVHSIILQAQANGSGYPIPLTWSNCSNNGSSNSITGDWTQSSLGPINNTCTTLIDLNGSSSARVTFTWWGNG